MEDYEKIRIVGRGAYGTVYLCRRCIDNYLVIIKQIPVEEMTKDERQAALNEVTVLSKFKHPNIIRYFHSFVEEKALMIAMEYAQGGTIYDYLQQRGGKLLDEDEILRLFVQILLALEHVHKENVLHRDLKTQNILLNKKRKVVKIGDFGISKILSSKSKANTVIGSPCYISPELCEGKSYNQKSDIWALGCVLYELATLKRAFEATNLPALVLKIIRGNFSSPIPERYGLELRRLILSMLSLDPAKRPGIPYIMAQPIVVNALSDLPTDVGRVPCTRIPKAFAGISAAIPPSRTKSTSVGGSRTVSQLPRTSSSNSACTILDGLPDNLGSFSLKSMEPQHIVYHWGGGITMPTKLHIPQNDSDVIQVSTGRTLKTGVTANGCMILWEGTKNTFASEANTWISRILEGQSGVTIVQVSCGDLFVACLTDRGILMTYGSGMHGCLGHGNTNDINQAKIVEALLGFEVEHVSCGSSHIMVVTADHEVFAWGHGDNGRLGTGSQDLHTSPVAVTLPDNLRVRSVHCGIDCSIAITLNNRMLACGSNRCNKLALDHQGASIVEDCLTFIAVEQPVQGLSVKAVSMGTSHTAILTQDGKCYTFGSNSFGQLGYERESGSRSPQCIECLNNDNLVHVSCGDTFTLAVSNDNKVFTWGKGARGRLGNGLEDDCRFPSVISLPTDMTILSVSCSHSSTLICGKVIQRN